MSSRSSEGLAARAAAADVLLRVERDGARAGPLLAVAERGLRDPRDRALLHETVLGVLRRLRSIDGALAAAGTRPVAQLDERVRAALRVGAHAVLYLDRIPDFAAVDSAVEVAKRGAGVRAAGYVNAVLRRIAARRGELLPPPPRPGNVDELAAHHDHPTWWVARRVERLGWERTVRLLAADNRPAPTVVRANLLRGTAAELGALLSAEGIETEPSPWVPDALRVVSGSPQRTRAFAEGRAYIQDEAAQLVAGLLAARPGSLVIDVCAAPGGKCVQLACDPAVAPTIVACDRSWTRLRRLTDNVRRLGAPRVFPVVADGERHPPPIARPADAVLVDAPCTATGTLRRHPEIRWRLAPEDPARAAERQGRLLARAAEVVAPGGRLVYAVCSLEEEEGEDVARRWAAAHPDFSVDREMVERVPGAARGWVGPDGALRTDPGDAGLDGFFAVAWVRAAR